jgi:hypothetical protein
MPPQNSNRGESKQSLEALIEALELSDLQKHFLRSRWLEQISWMGGRSRNARNWYYKLRLTAIIGGIIVPILVGLNTSDRSLNQNAAAVRWFTIGLSGVVAVSAAVEEFFHFGDRWRHYRRTAESLKTQGWQFSQLSGLYNGYKSHQEAFSNFAAQVEDILQRDVDIYVTEVVRENKKGQERGDRELTREIIHKPEADSVSETAKSE